MALILIADDDVEMRRLLGEVLSRDGLDVELLADGAAVMQRLESMVNAGQFPQLVIVDIHMPYATGLQVLAWVRQRLPAVAVILISAFGDWPTYARARRLGAAAVFDKPFELDDLRSAVTRILDAAA